MGMERNKFPMSHEWWYFHFPRHGLAGMVKIKILPQVAKPRVVDLFFTTSAIIGEWDNPCIARVMVRITLSGGVSNVSQQLKIIPS